MEKKDLKYLKFVGNDNHPYCINDFIKYLQGFDESRRKLPLICFNKNGTFTEPCIKMVRGEDSGIYDEPIALTITTNNI